MNFIGLLFIYIGFVLIFSHYDNRLLKKQDLPKNEGDSYLIVGKDSIVEVTNVHDNTGMWRDERNKPVGNISFLTIKDKKEIVNEHQISNSSN